MRILFEPSCQRNDYLDCKISPRGAGGEKKVEFLRRKRKQLPEGNG